MYMGNSELKVIGIDISKDLDVSVLTEGYYKDGIIYITKIEEIKGENK